MLVSHSVLSFVPQDPVSPTGSSSSFERLAAKRERPSTPSSTKSSSVSVSVSVSVCVWCECGVCVCVCVRVCVCVCDIASVVCLLPSFPYPLPHLPLSLLPPSPPSHHTQDKAGPSMAQPNSVGPATNGMLPVSATSPSNIRTHLAIREFS